MNTLEKIKLLGAAAKYDTCASSASPRKININSKNNKDRLGDVCAGGVCHSFNQDGRCISLFKVLYSNACSFDCKYCTNASNCKDPAKKAAFHPEELAKTFMQLYIRNYVEGIFLSSAILSDPDNTTEKMIQTIRLIRKKHNFQGYIHFKILPGTNIHLIKEASDYADRLSINLEAPNQSRLSEISSVKNMKNDIIRRQLWMKRMKIPSGQTTQLVVGSSDETDLEILKTINWEYENINLKRAYYSAFIPVPKTPLEKKDRTPLHREHRLYNVDFLMRKYNLPLKDFKQIMDDGMLPKKDPKLALAQATFDGHLDINEASYDDLLRVPGIGPFSAQRIMQFRKKGGKIKKARELHNIGVVMKRALPFIKFNGTYQKTLSEVPGNKFLVPQKTEVIA